MNMAEGNEDWYDNDNDTESGNYSYESDECIKDKLIKFGTIVTPVFFTVVIMFSFVGNTLVIRVLIKYENLRSLTNAFLLNLAISDLIFTAGLPFWATYMVSGWIFGDLACKGVNFIFFVGFYSSTLFLTVMTVHRYVAVVHPLSVTLTRKTYNCVAISAFIWLLSFCAATPHAILKVCDTLPGDPMNLTYCECQDVFCKRLEAYLQNGFFLIAFITITFCYIEILCRLLRPTSHTRRKTVRLILCIVVVFFLGWAPYNLAILFNSLITFEISPFNECPFSTNVDYIYFVSRLVAFSHCSLNPVFYVFMGIKFRSHLKKLLVNFCRNETPVQNRHSRLIYSNGEEISMY